MKHLAKQFDFPFLSEFRTGDEVIVTPTLEDDFSKFRGRVISVETKDVWGYEIEPKVIVEDETTGCDTGKDWLVVMVYPHQCKFIE